MKYHYTILFAILLSVFLCGTAAVAAPIQVNSVDGDWANPTLTSGDPNDATIDNASDPSTIYWGDPVSGSDRSGYSFDAVDTPFYVTPDTGPFALGDFTHYNYPVYTPWLTSVDLIIDLGVTGFSPITATFEFSHNETPNDPGPVNDEVTLVNPILNASFSDADYTYYFNLLGFSQDSGSTITTFFSTVEEQTNTATLYATITSRPIGQVPEPATMLFLGTGLIGLAVIRRKFKTNI